MKEYRDENAASRKLVKLDHRSRHTAAALSKRMEAAAQASTT